MIRAMKYAAILGLVAAIGCGDDGGNEASENNAENNANNTNNANNPDSPHPNVACDDDKCTITGEITEDLTLTADTNWLLSGGVFVGDDTDETVLTIEPGTTVYGQSGTSFLTVRRGSKLIADGTAAEPIVFTSAKAPGSRARGDWGGLIINGRAPINGCDSGVCEAEGEGGTGLYGGDDPSDSSGTLRYVRVEFAGTAITSENELNGIAFQGVGSGTEIDHIQVHMNKDDGIEFFGGTAQAKHVLLTGIGDDSLDWTDGWQGKVQFLIAQQYDDGGDQGIEADNNGDNNDLEPRSMPTISHATFLGAGAGAAGSDTGILLREGTGAKLHSIAVSGFNDGCLNIDQEATFLNAVDAAGALNGNLTMVDSALHCPDSSDFVDDEEDFTPPFTVEAWFTELNDGNILGELQLEAPQAETPEFMPTADSPLLGAGEAPADDWFETADFIGGMGDEDWTAGWTTNARN